MATENVKLTDRHSEFVRQSVESGRYEDVSEVITAGLRLLEQQEAADAAKLRALQKIAEDGFAASDQGAYRTYTVDTLHELFDEIDEKIRTSSVD